MGKAPAFQFYVKDWLSDPQLRMASFSTKGIWIDMLCFMWQAPVKGELCGDASELQKLLGSNDNDFQQFIVDVNKYDFCYISVSDNKIITVRNRRMFRDENDKKNNRERQARYQSKRRDNKNITPPSSSASASPSSKKKNNTAPTFNFETLSWENLNGKMEIWAKAYPAVDIKAELNKMVAWFDAHKKNRKSNYLRFITSWLSKAQDRAPGIKDSSKGGFPKPWKQSTETEPT
jgi:hypothetical protein